MNEATRWMVARDPLVSVASLRLFKRAGVTSAQRLPGIRCWVYGPELSIWTREARPSKFVRLIRATGYGRCVVHHVVGANIVLLGLDDPEFSCGESMTLTPELSGTAPSRLVSRGKSLPDMLLTGSIGRRLVDIVGSDERPFLLLRRARIVDAAAQRAAPDIELILADKWMKLSRFLIML